MTDGFLAAVDGGGLWKADHIVRVDSQPGVLHRHEESALPVEGLVIVGEITAHERDAAIPSRQQLQGESPRGFQIVIAYDEIDRIGPQVESLHYGTGIALKSLPSFRRVGEARQDKSVRLSSH